MLMLAKNKGHCVRGHKHILISKETPNSKISSNRTENTSGENYVIQVYCKPDDLDTRKSTGTSCQIEIHFMIKTTEYLL